jgi:hypothetical protein
MKRKFELKFKPKSRRITKKYKMMPTQEISEEMIEEVLEDDLESTFFEIITEEADAWLREELPTPPPPPRG